MIVQLQVGGAGCSVTGCLLYMSDVLFTFFKEDRLTRCFFDAPPPPEGTHKNLLKGT